MRNFDLKKLAKDMSIHDKAKLLFADHNMKCASEGRQRLLTANEENAICEDCRKKGQIRELNRLNNFYNLKNKAVGMAFMCRLQLELVISQIEMLILLCTARVKGEDNNELGFDTFEDAEGKDVKPEPNVVVQKFFVKALMLNKELRQALYKIEYAENQAGMQMPCDIEEGIVASAKEQLGKFQNMDGLFGIILRFYQEALKSGTIRDQDYTEPEFLRLLRNVEEAVLLTEEDRRFAEARVNRWLSDY